MKWHRIQTILLHSWYHFTHSMETWVDVYWFSFIDVIIFGLISLFFARETGSQNVSFIVLGIILWEIIRVGQYSLPVGILWEIWSKSLSSLFMTPLTLAELIVGQIISSFIKICLVFMFTSILGIVFYHFSIFVLGPVLLLYIFELLIFAWAIGLLVLGLLFRFGTDIQSLAWSLIFIVQPITGMFYPISILPQPIRLLSYLFPVTYVMEAARGQLTTGIINFQFLFIATGLNIVYFMLCFWFMHFMFEKAKESGRFARMEG